MVPALPSSGHSAPTYIIFGTANPSDTQSSSDLIPEQLREAYGLDTYNSSGAVVNAISYGGIAGDGTGQTIAIVDAYDDPNAASDLSTFSTNYGLPQFNTSGDPTFTKLNETGGTTLPSADPSGKLNGSNSDWELEESLDIEWAHAMAPMANIILFEASSTSDTDLYTAAQTAAKTPGVVDVSMSFSGAEFSGETSDDSYFSTPSGHLGGAISAPVYSTGLVEAGNIVTFTAANTFTAGESVTIAGAAPAGFNGTYVIAGATASSFTYTDPTSGLGTATTQATAAIDLAGGVTFLAATGDTGAYASGTTTITPQYPASSPNVMAVGGTVLTVNQSTAGEYSYYSETSWGNGASSGIPADGGGGGGGISGVTNINPAESQPSYQAGVVSSTYSTDAGTFTTPHRTYPDVSADADGSVLVYDSYSTVGNLWSVGGTSLATPLWAGMIAVADQGRAITGAGSLYGATQTLPQLYSLAAGNSYTDYFNDVNSGNAIGTTTAPSYSPSAGYDAAYNLATGLGSPKAAALISMLATPPSMLAFGQGPSNTAAGASFSPALTVDVENALGQIVTTDSSNVTLSFGSNPSGGRLLGTLTVAAVNGVATFSGLSIDTAGNGYTLVASDGGLSTATSAAFNITANANQPTVSTPAGASLAGAKTAALSVVGADPQNETLTYAWSAISVPSGASSPTFVPTNAAQNTTATFNAAGTYEFLVMITDSSGFSNDSTVSFTLNPSLTSLSITQGSETVSAASQDQFTAAGIDQFGNSMGIQSSAAWSATFGAITSAGMYTPPALGSSDTVKATLGGLTTTASVMIAAPVGWWKLNEGSGATADDYGQTPADNGSITSGTWIQPPSSIDESHALKFNGSSSVVSLNDPSKLQFTGQITLSAWIDPSSITSTQYVIAHGASTTNDVFLMLSGGSYEVGLNNGSFHGASYAIPSGDLNTWVQLVGTYDGMTWRLYRDGQQVASSTYSTGATNPSGNWDIGAGTTTSRSGKQSLTRYFSGSIGDVRIYSTAISPTAVSALAAAPPTVSTAAAASPSTVTGTTTALSVLGADNAGASALTYTWATSGTPPAAVAFSPNGNNAASNTTATFSTAGTYNFVVTITNVVGLTAASSVSVTVETAPGVTSSPSNQTVAAGSTATFTAAASGSPAPGVQWAVNTGSGSFTNLTDTGVYSGSSTDTLTITGATTVMSGYQYEAVFTNSIGSVTTTAVTLNVDSITTQPVNQTINAGQDASFTVASSNPADAVQWEVNAGSGFTALSDGGVYSGTATGALNITGATAGMNGYQYEAVITNTAGTLTSSAATLTVNPVATVADWNSASDGPWNSPDNWSDTQGTGTPGFSGAGGDQATFSGAAGLNVDLGNFSPSLAGLTFGSSALNYDIKSTGGGVLQLNNGSSNATVTVSAGSQTIAAPVQLVSNTVVYPAASAMLNVSGGVDGAGQSLSVDDQGTVILSGVNSYTGGTMVSAGTLIVTDTSAIPANTGLTVGANGTVIFLAPVTLSGSVATPSSASVSNSAGDLLVAPSATAATPAVALPSLVSPPAPQTSNLSESNSTPNPIASHDFRAGRDVVNKSTAGNLPSSIMPAVTVQPPQSVSAGALRTPAADRVDWSSMARRTAANLAWLGQAVNGSDESDQHHKRAAAILTLDAVFAQYGILE